MSEWQVGAHVRQIAWLLPRGCRDGVIVGLGERAVGTPHRWLIVEFKGHLTGKPIYLNVSSAQLKLTGAPDE